MKQTCIIVGVIAGAIVVTGSVIYYRLPSPPDIPHIVIGANGCPDGWVRGEYTFTAPPGNCLTCGTILHAGSCAPPGSEP